jgi:hypothetical protein
MSFALRWDKLGTSVGTMWRLEINPTQERAGSGEKFELQIKSKSYKHLEFSMTRNNKFPTVLEPVQTWILLLARVWVVVYTRGNSTGHSANTHQKRSCLCCYRIPQLL